MGEVFTGWKRNIGVQSAVATAVIFSAWLVVELLSRTSTDRRVPDNVAPSQLGVARQLARVHAHIGYSRDGEIRTIGFVGDLDDNDPEVFDQDLLCIRGLASLKELDLTWTRVNGAGLSLLRTLPQLTELAMCVKGDRELDNIIDCRELRSLRVGGNFTCNGLRRIAELPKLKKLVVYSTNLYGDNIALLNNIGTLNDLNLYDVPISDETLQSVLPTLKRLKVFGVCKASISDKGLAILGQLDSLKKLSIDHNSITDHGIAQIRSIQTLEELSISFNPISDAAIDDLIAMGHLKRLRVQNTEMTPGGIKRLQNARPLLSIEDYHLSYNKRGHD